MKVQAESLEIFDFLLAEIREIESVTNTEEINTDDLIKLDRPLSEWDDVLKSNGFESKLLQEFLLSAEVLELWKGEEPLIAIYQQAIEKSLTTGDFLVLLFSQDPKFLESLLNLVSPLLSERADLMEVAAGKLGKKGDVLVGLGAYYGTALLVGAVVAYKNRKTIVPEVRELYTTASEAISNNHYVDRLLKFTKIRAEQQLKEVVFADIKGDYGVKIDFPEFSNKDKFELALKLIDPGPLPKLSSGEVVELRRDVRVDRLNPEEFCLELKAYLSKNFNIKPNDYLTVLRTEYDKVVAEAEEEFFDELDKIIEAQIRSDRVYRNKIYEGGGLTDIVLKRERRILVELAKDESVKENFDQWLSRVDTGERMVQLRSEFAQTEENITTLKAEHLATLDEIKTIEGKKGVSLPDLQKQAKVLTKDYDDLERLYKDELEVQKVTKTNLDEQLADYMTCRSEIERLRPVYNEMKELEKVTSERLAQVIKDELVIGDKLGNLNLKGLNSETREDFEQQSRKLISDYQQKVGERTELSEKLKNLLSQDSEIKKFEIQLDSFAHSAKKVELIRELEVSSSAKLKVLKGKIENITVEVKEVNALESELTPLYSKSTGILNQIKEAEINNNITKDRIDALSTEFTQFNKNIMESPIFVERSEWMSAAEKMNHDFIRINAKTKACQAFKLCDNLENSLANARLNIRNKLKYADINAFKDWINSTNLPKLKYIQKTFGSDIAQMVKDKAKISDDLPEIEEQIVVEFGPEALDQIKLAIDSELAQVLDDTLEPIVKTEAHEIFKEIWTAEEGVENDLDNYFDNLVEELV